MAEEIFFFNSKLNILSFIFLIWTEQFWIWFSRKLTKNIKIPVIFASFPLPPVWLLNLGSDLSVDNIVRLGSADTKIVSQDAVRKVLELTEKWKYPNFGVKLYFFFFFFFSKICWKHDAPLQLLGIHYSSVFYSNLLSFFVLKIFGSN